MAKLARRSPQRSCLRPRSELVCVRLVWLGALVPGPGEARMEAGAHAVMFDRASKAGGRLAGQQNGSTRVCRWIAISRVK